MPVRLVTVNIEGHHHLDKFLPVLKELNLDVVCFQEIFEQDCELIAQELGMQYRFLATQKVEQPNQYRIELLGNWGIAMMSRLPMEEVISASYSSFSDIKVFQQPNDNLRTLLAADIKAADGDYRIATTHFTWSPEGDTTDEQRQDFERLLPLLNNLSRYVLCGDLNAPRGREMFTLFLQAGLIDHLPQEITTTIDTQLHYSGKPLELVVDTIFSTPGYEVKNVRTLSGISDHLGIFGEVYKTA